MPGFEVKAVDTTGDVNAFTADSLAGLLKHYTASRVEASLRNICRFASAAGILAVTGRGAIPFLPTSRQVETFLQQQTVR